MQNPTHIIKKPLLTEKGTFASSEFNRHCFLVDRLARKDAIKAAVEELYGVRVIDVATQNRKGKRKRTRFGWVVESTTKKATVKIHPEDTIELL
ncbi:MAG: 50S ribosomal protein L23 [Phycisphaeraceae bacterium]|nr:50S ribosomal protein L23 [Phycisphaeraceae bacterium]MCB9847279.1 50S ribosomal protein L23 [Phycisphaeraceae bacterium]